MPYEAQRYNPTSNASADWERSRYDGEDDMTEERRYSHNPEERPRHKPTLPWDSHEHNLECIAREIAQGREREAAAKDFRLKADKEAERRRRFFRGENQ